MMKVVHICQSHWTCFDKAPLGALLLFLMVACGRVDDSDTASRAPADMPGASLRVSQAHMYVMPPGQSRAAIYMRLENHTQTNHTLLHASTPLAGSTEVHHTVHEEGVMKMREVRHLNINPGQVIDFEPGGYHLMLLDVSQPPAASDRIELTLEFDGLTLTVPVSVRALE